MILAKVIGNVVADTKIESYKGRKVLVVQPIDPDGKPKGKTILAVDGVQAGIGDRVVVCDEGGSARYLLETDVMTIRTVVAGIVDEVNRTVS